jgi:hypothetical protein
MPKWEKYYKKDNKEWEQQTAFKGNIKYNSIA